MHRAECCQPTPSRVTRAAYLILGRGGLWAGWRWDGSFYKAYTVLRANALEVYFYGDLRNLFHFYERIIWHEITVQSLY